MKHNMIGVAMILAATLGMSVTASAAQPSSTKALAEQGDGNAQYSVAVMYDNGKGFTKDYEKAAKWYQKAAEQGHAKAQFNLGNMYEHGEGVTQDNAKALSWWVKAAEQGATKAQFNLALINKENKNYSKAIEWYQKAVDQGHADSQNNLGVMYAEGLGVPKSPAKARELFEKAAKQNQEYADHNIRTIDSMGQLTPLQKHQYQSSIQR